MRKFLLIATFLFASTSVAFGQDSFIRPSVSSTVPNNLRYEVVPAIFNWGNITLRLDKFSGRVFYLTGCPQRNVIGTGLCWKETIVLELPKPSNDSIAKFQIFAQGDATKFTLLINNLTGQTWQLGMEDGIHKWTPLLDPVPLPQSFEIVR